MGRIIASTWRRGLPVIESRAARIRGLEPADAPSLLKHLARAPVLKYIAPPPPTEEGFRSFIRWTHLQRRKGTLLTFGLVPPDDPAAVGMLQIWPIGVGFTTSEWGFAIGEEHWGTGLFVEGAKLLLDFAFDVLGVARLEARAMEANQRGNAVLMKLGAQPEGRLRGAVYRDRPVADFVMWSILSDEWADRRCAERIGS
jgi:RimJ/RimL family protein N-acetyltransferase